ncbi:AMP-binding protein [Terrilactibacillus sp. S3-3]|nr:AMP-binding protein [Terrilactibacillus sp. S3-3]
MLTHSNVVNMAVINAEELNCTAEDVFFFLAVPVFHVFGFVPGILSTIASGARMVLMEKYKRKAALELIESEKVTVKYGVPTMFILELSYKDFTKYDLSSLRTGIIAAAPCPVEIVKKIRYEMGCDIMIAYGLSETSPCLTMTRFDDSDIIRAETVGRPLPGVELKIVNENREEVGTGEVGEVACRSLGLMKGYYKMPEKTAEVIDENGWFYTGDMGTIDEEGHLRMIGRKKEMIIRGGFNIYPKEVEEVLYTHPDVMEVAIVGLPDTVLGEVSCACV